ncbi:hypothetical protein SEEGA711_19781 [Salmonella enterica subsp. enterica serovar Gaminara str. ATCC BAA-711]|nr:hypothetical protein SEEGA711_19781 [Salmonella enterica subsp. enterica serovar Gaminara str. ATCC BAA-711]
MGVRIDNDQGGQGVQMARKTSCILLLEEEFYLYMLLI